MNLSTILNPMFLWSTATEKERSSNFVQVIPEEQVFYKAWSLFKRFSLLKGSSGSIVVNLEPECHVFPSNCDDKALGLLLSSAKNNKRRADR